MELKLNAQIREKTEKLGADFIPAILYGKGIESQSLKLKRSDFEKLFTSAGESNLIDLDYGSGSTKVLVKDLQRDILKDFITHVDLYQVNMKEKITTEIPLNFIGESRAVKELGGMIIKELRTIEVECLPNDLVDHIDVDISVLNNFDDAILANDLKLPENIKLANENNNVVVTAKAPRVEEEVQEVEEEVEEGEEKEEGKEGEKKEDKPAEEGEKKDESPEKKE